jgi:tricorn protease
MATDIWLFHLTEFTSKKITDWEGTDTQPMWQGDKIYYLSDAGRSHRLNIWEYDINSGKQRQITKYSDYDVKWPSNGPGPDGKGEIVFQLGPDLVVLNLATERTRTVKVTIPGDRPKIRPQTLLTNQLVYSGGISSTGKRAVAEARGNIWTLPAKNGPAIALQRTSGVAERNPAWSPDGKWIAYFSDETGEYQLYIMQSDGRGETRKLTSVKGGFLYNPTWSPDSKWITFWDKFGKLYLTDVENEKTEILHSANLWQARPPISWSHDSNWLTFALSDKLTSPGRVLLYSIPEGEMHKVTSGMFNDSWPTFDREGKYMYLASNREFSSPLYEDVGTTWIYTKTDRLYVIPLREDVESPLKPKSDEEEWKKEEEAEDEGGKEDEGKGEEGKEGVEKEGADKAEDKAEGESEEKEDEEKKEEPLKIDIEGFEQRMIPVPVSRGNFYQMSVNDKGNLIYMRGTTRGEDGEPSIHILDLSQDKDEDKEKTVIDGVLGYDMSGDGKMLLVVNRARMMAIINAASDQKMKDIINTSGMTVEVDPREEWRQIFNDAWRIQRDFFYDPNMHGVDWKAVKKKYEPMLEDCASREDVSYVIREMISELNVGHAYYFGGDVEDSPRVNVGMPGCDFKLDNGAYQIVNIIEGGPWDADARGPLSQPGTDIKEGDYLLAVNGVPVDASKDPWAAFQGLASTTVTLTVNEEPLMNDKVRHVLVELEGSDYMLRYRAWVEKNRAHVDEKTDGKVGYIYVPNTSIFGQNELVRQFFGQTTKEALIIDERWNGGGQIPTRFVELLNRPIANYWALRNSTDDFPWPPDAHQGPKCMLINGLAGSGGDYFPYWFREAGVGKLIGTRTWGGLVGLSGNPALIDGGYTSAPTFGFFETDGTWGIEGHGVDPDIEVVDDPALMVGGKDVQLDAAIEYMLEEIERNPYVKPKRPAFPDRSGMGVKDKDK